VHFGKRREPEVWCASKKDDRNDLEDAGQAREVLDQLLDGLFHAPVPPG
jgi:hypothetical protein